MRLGGFAIFCSVLFLNACSPFINQESGTPEIITNDDVVIGLGNLQKKKTLEIKGQFEDGRFKAHRIEIEEPDDEVELKGLLTSAITEGRGAVGGIEFYLAEDSKLVNPEGDSLAPTDFSIGAFVKAECIERSDGLRLRKITLRQRKQDEREQLQGEVSRVDFGSGELEIGGITVHFDGNVPVVWDVDNEPAPMRRDASPGSQRGLRRVRVIDDDNWRPASQFRLGDWLSIGGEIQVDSEWRNNHNLRDNRDNDRLFHDISAKTEFTLTPDPHLFAFFSLDINYRAIHFDEDSDRDGGDDVNLEEAFVLLEDLPAPGISLQIGRQDFDHGREWFMDDQIDGARIWLNLDPAVAEFSLSRVLWDTDPEEDGITNYLAGLHARPLRDTEIFLAYMHRSGGSLLRLDRHHIGLSADGQIDAFEWWLDAGHSYGREEGRRISGFGIDAAAMWVFEDLSWEPSLIAGIAWGSGDNGDPSGTDRAFRQTGIQDNTDRWNGVTSFRYLGEVVRPELSNLLVLTAGFGIRLGDRTSIDFVWHHYRQSVAAPFIRDTRLRLRPTGDSRDIGNAYEVIIGVRDFRPLELELVLGWFQPGAAFGPEHDAAMFATIQVEWNF